MDRKEVVSPVYTRFWGLIRSRDTTNPYNVVVNKLQAEHMLDLSTSVRPWQRVREGTLAVHTTYEGFKVINRITSSSEFAIVYQLSQHAGTPDQYVKRWLPDTQWGESFKKRVHGTCLQQRADYLAYLVEKDGRTFDRQEVRSEIGMATAEAKELLEGLQPLDDEDFLQLLDSIVQVSIKTIRQESNKN